MSKVTSFLMEGLGLDVSEGDSKVQLSLRVDAMDIMKTERLQEDLHKTRSEILRTAISAGLDEMLIELHNMTGKSDEKIGS